MLHPKILSCVFLIFILFQAGAGTIQSITIEGLKRTRESEVYALVDIKEGDEFSVGAIRQAEIVLRKADIFASVNIRTEELVPDEVDVIIELEEKWTLIPLPFAYVNGGNFGGGLFLLESNLFGNRQVLVSGYVYSPSNQFLLISFSDPAIGESSIGLSTALSFREAPTAKDPEDREASSLSLSEAISWKTDIELTPRFGINYTMARMGSLFDEDIDLQQYLLLPLSMGYDPSVPGEFFSSGGKGSLKWTPGLALPGGDYNQRLEISGQYSFVPFEKHQLEAYVEADYKDLPAELARKAGGSRGTRTIDQSSITSDLLISGDLSYQWAFWSNQILFTSLTLFTESGLYHHDPDTGGMYSYYGGGGGFRLYMKKIAIPAFGADIGYNFTEEKPQFSIFLGMSM